MGNQRMEKLISLSDSSQFMVKINKNLSETEMIKSLLILTFNKSIRSHD